MIDRRNWLRRAGCGFGSLAAAALLQDEVASVAATARNPLTPRSPHFPAKARSVIFLYMHGGASHIDSFDYRPNSNAGTERPSPPQ